MTHTNLGTALLTLGERVGGTEHLEDAISAFDAALTVFVPARGGLVCEHLSIQPEQRA